MRRLPLDFRDQYFGCEIELTGINRATAAQTLADLFGTRAEHSGGGYDAYRVKDLDGKEWKIVRDGSIHPECRRRSVLIGETYKVELNSPKLEYGEMEKLQEVVRALRRAGGIVNDSCGMHVHVDASKHTPQSLKNVLSIMYSKEDILFAALKVNPARIDSYCQAVDEPILEEIRKLPSGASMDQLKDRWYQGRDGSDYHYHSSRYRACNMHSVFYHGTIEWRLFNSTLHAGEAKANIILAMAISAQGILDSLYDETQQWIMENYPDSYAAQTYIAAAEELVNGTDAQSGENGYYTYIYNPPAGYLLDSTPVDVEFTYEGQQIAWQVVDGTNTNLRTTVDISKQDITNGKELPGAKLEIRAADGNLVEGWTSGKTPHTVRGLELEKEYTMTETRAPDGYAEAESIVFKLVQDGSEQSNMVYVKSDDDWVKLDDTTVVMQDAPVLDIDKTDIAGNLLPGATLTIRDENNEVVDTWTTDYKTHRIPISDDSLKLSDDSKEYIYTLTEDAAPAGFEIAESVQFKVQQADKNVCLFVRENVDAEWVRADKRFIQMIDEATPREETPAPTPTPTPQPTPAATPAPTPVPTPVITPRKVQTLPQTGDGFPLLAIVVVSLVSSTGIVLLTVKQKNALKETSDEEDADESADC